MSERLQALADAGVSIWLDDLSRERIESGNLTDLVKDRNVVGVTTNPTIFAAALADGERYDDQGPRARRRRRRRVEGDRSSSPRGRPQRRATCCSPSTRRTRRTVRVSIEVDPFLAHDTDGTIKSAQDLWRAVDRPNVLVKIPATDEGLPAIRRATAEGISVNVTLIFSLERLPQGDGRLPGRPRGREGRRQSTCRRSTPWRRCVVSRVDNEVDKRLGR
jgi:transaldolase